MDSEAFKAQLAQFAAEYRTALPAKLADIDALWAKNADRASLTELHRHLHMLAGSARTFGFPAVGEAARQAEHAIEPLIRGGAELDEDARRRIAAGLAALRAVAMDP